jgi:hypothetical protein
MHSSWDCLWHTIVTPRKCGPRQGPMFQTRMNNGRRLDGTMLDPSSHLARARISTMTFESTHRMRWKRQSWVISKSPLTIIMHDSNLIHLIVSMIPPLLLISTNPGGCCEKLSHKIWIRAFAIYIFTKLYSIKLDEAFEWFTITKKTSAACATTMTALALLLKILVEAPSSHHHPYYIRT